MEDLQGGTLALEHRYDLERRAGEYALFSLYRGVQHPFERPVWVKVCEAPHAFGVPAAYERIKRAVVEASTFEHPQVATVVDFGDIDTHLPFVVTERREGVPLDDYLEKHGTLTPEEALEIAVRVAEIVGEAHDRGLVHGGLAPRWITVADDGVHLDHFGMQATMQEIREYEGAILSEDLLWALPPEQFGDDPVEHSTAADLWAIGALLYWMLSGVHPYLEDPTDTSEAVLRLRNGARPPSLADVGFDEDLAEFVAKAIAPDPEERHSSAAALLRAAPAATAATTEVREEVEVPAVDLTRTAPAQGNVGSALVAVLVILLLTNLGWFFYTTSQEPDAPSELPTTAPDFLPVGVELETLPPGSKILQLDGTAEKEFGDTPLVLDPKALPGGSLPLIVRQRGHRDVRLDVRTTPEGHELTVHLAPDGEQASTE